MKLIAVLIPVILVLTVISGCTNETDIFYIDTGDIIPNELCYPDIQDKVIVFHSTHCPACKVTLPKLQLAEARTGVDFEYIEVDTEDGIERIKELKISPYGVPTVVINCVVYGIMDQEEYEDIILRTW